MKVSMNKRMIFEKHSDVAKMRVGFWCKLTKIIKYFGFLLTF